MAGNFFRKMVITVFMILKWILQAAFAALKLIFWMAELLLILAVLAVSGASSIAGVTSGRR